MAKVEDIQFRNEGGFVRLYVPRNGETYEVLVDEGDWDRIRKECTSMGVVVVECRYNYTYCYVYKRKSIKLHRFIMEPPEDKVIDHLDGNTLDNRKSNLQVTTQSINARRKKYNGVNAKNKSGHRNVSWKANHEKWEVKITKNGKRYYFGEFDDVAEAGRVAEIKRKELGVGFNG